MNEGDKDWTYTLPNDGKAFPNDLVEILWSYVTWDTMESQVAYSIEQLRALIFPAFAASLHSEEGRPVRFRMLFDFMPHKETLRFKEPQSYTVNNLIKLAPTIGLDFRYLIVAPETTDNDSHLLIWGLLDPTLLNKQMPYNLLVSVQELWGFRISVLDAGTIRIETRAGAVFELSNCNIRFPFPISQVRLISDWYLEAAMTQDFLPQSRENNDDPRILSAAISLIRRTWESALSQVASNHHGGTFLVVPNIEYCKDLLKIKYGLESNALRKVIQERLALEPELSLYVPGNGDIDLAKIDRVHFLERNLVHITNLLVSLSAVDGAVVISRDLTIYGFGAEIQLTQNDSEVEKVEYSSKQHVKHTDRLLSSFGMRHRSAYRFCKNVKDSLVFVISQDGDLRLFRNESGKVTLVDSISHNVWGCVFRMTSE